MGPTGEWRIPANFPDDKALGIGVSAGTCRARAGHVPAPGQLNEIGVLTAALLDDVLDDG
jgi:hypothetical protein